MDPRQLTRWFLRVFIVSIIATTIMGIAAITLPTVDGWWEFKILLTTATITGASVCGLACGGSLSRGHKLLPISGLLLTVISAVSVVAGIWFEIEAEWFWKVTATLICFAVACSHLSMLFLARLAGCYRWSYIIAYQLILGLAGLVSVAIIFESFVSETYIRFIGVVSILVAAITLLIPIFHYMSRNEVGVASVAADPLLAVDEQIASLKKRLMELEAKRRELLGRE